MPLVKNARGCDLWVERYGAGRPVLFLHGWSVDSTVWRQQVKFFARRYQVITVDLPGHGRSPWRPVSFEQMADSVIGLLSVQTGEPVSCVGSSLGGLLALKIAHQAPALVRSLTMVGALPRFAYSVDNPHGLGPERVHKLAGQLQADYPRIVPVFFRSLFTRQERQTRRYRWVQIFRRTEGVPDRDALLALLDVLTGEDLRKELADLSIPVQFINGTGDVICPAAAFSDITRRGKRVRVDWFEHCGHFPFLTEPARFNEVLDEFLRKTI